MAGAPEQHCTPPRFTILYLFTYPPPTGSDQHLTKQYTGLEHPKPRFHPRFVHSVGSITRKNWRRAVGFRISHLPSWCVVMRFRVFFRFICERDSFLSTDKATGPLSPSRAQRHEVKPVVQTLQNVRIPASALHPRPNPRMASSGRKGRRDLSHGERPTDADDDDAIQDWNERASSLFEWIGMVNIGAQRHVPHSVFLVDRP
jgi:hypothetical protein